MADPFSSILSSLADNLFANYRQNDQQAFNAQQFATRYQTTVKDMQAAGLNPMLAYGQGAGAGASSGISSSSGSFTQGYGQYQENKRMEEVNSAQVAKLAADTDVARQLEIKTAAEARSASAKALVDERYALEQGGANLDLTRLQAGSLEATIQNTLAQTALTAQQTQVAIAQAEKIAAEIKNIPLEGDRLVAAAKQLMSSAENLRQQSISEADRRKVLTAQAIQIAKQANLLGFDISAAEKFDNLGREAGQAKPLVDILKSVIGAFKR